MQLSKMMVSTLLNLFLFYHLIQDRGGGCNGNSHTKSVNPPTLFEFSAVGNLTRFPRDLSSNVNIQLATENRGIIADVSFLFRIFGRGFSYGRLNFGVKLYDR